MAASPLAATDGEHPAIKHADNWNPMDVNAAHMGPGGDLDTNGAPHPVDDRVVSNGDGAGYPAPDSVTGNGVDSAAARADAAARGEKIIKLNKVYIGGLPEHTRKEDLESCFGKIGNIVNIELKVGYGFVEFDSREAAEESVAKYHEGYFMGNKIRVEISHGGGRTAKYSGDPGACFKCGQMGHWARECPNHLANGRRPSEAPLIDRIQAPRDYLPPPRDYPYRGDYARYPPIGDPRYYEYPPPPIRREGPYGRPASPPPRDFREYPPPPPPVRSARDYDEYRMRGPPPPALPPARFEARGYYPEGEAAPPPGYPPRGYPPPPPRDYYERYERGRAAPPPPADRYGSYPPPAARPRTPPGAPPARAARDDYDRPPPRDYAPADARGRAASPARYDYPPPRAGSVEAARYRRRSQSPPSRSASGAPYDSAGYSAGSGGAAYNGGNSGGYANGYSNGAPPPPRSSGGSREYAPPRARDPEPAGSYRRA
ncbi:hypothetical protein L226DRAFT_527914 [Lentinus tigrinus ALCF2SS1-7]|uniref:RNA-binding domain-containing protein n=1 Tax=Lentinus tigrinus ALCF2SS1-6 TaxID=1328759 RepID=A0A5C2S428_9APHY|nr:hypothetical protein L227DRAFT_577083 [Lentinus tigrinus ALCF2SS1-6]RPD81645.1 hypothetical protein L226DRAFT_527914 [Lentinus tigrinus ALCF2SS1-7]